MFLWLDAGRDPVRVKLASLQSPEARDVLSKRGLRPEAFISPGNAKDETVVFIDANGQLHVRSAAVRQLCRSQVSPALGTPHSRPFGCRAMRVPLWPVLPRCAQVLKAVAHVAPCWLYALCTLALLVPACLRDAVYKLVARNRIQLFGAMDTCRRATKEDKKHFL